MPFALPARMEDLVSRAHAQQVVAAALYLGTKAVDRALQRHLASRNYVELRMDGVAHSREMVQQLQILAGDAFRRASATTRRPSSPQPTREGVATSCAWSSSPAGRRSSPTS